MSSGAIVVNAAVVLALVGLRAMCVRRMSADSIPVVLRHRVELGNRLAPVLSLLAACALVAGVVVWAS